MSIASRIEAIEQHLTDDYSVLTLAGADLTNVDKNILNLKPTWKERLLYFMNNGTQEVWDNWEKVVGEGTTITLNNTEEAPMTIVLKGNTSQEGTPTPEAPQDIHVVSGDNSIEVKGKNLLDLSNTTKQQNIFIPNPMKEAGTYTISCVNTNQSYSFAVCFVNNIGDQTSQRIGGYFAGFDFGSTRTSYTQTITQEQANANYLLFALNSGATTIDNIATLKLMLEKGNQATTYEAYKGASYPISLGVENIFNKNASGKPAYAIKTPIETGVRVIITSAGQNRYYGMNIGADELLGKTITISETITPSASNTGQTYLFFGNSTAVTTSLITNSGITGTGKQTKTISIPSSFPTNCDRIWFLIYANGAGTGNVDDYVDYTDLQMEIGSTAHSYTPYGKAIELCKIGDYQDTIVKDNGKWYLNKQIGKVVLNGSESWAKSSNTNVNRYYIPGTFINTILNVNTIDLISDYFTCITPTQSDAYNVGLSKLNNTSIMANFSLSDTSFDTLQKFKTWLSTHNTELYYVLATPTYTEITDSTLISQLEALKEAESYSGQTNISQVNNDKPFIITAKALKDLSNL